MRNHLRITILIQKSLASASLAPLFSSLASFYTHNDTSPYIPPGVQQGPYAGKIHPVSSNHQALKYTCTHMPWQFLLHLLHCISFPQHVVVALHSGFVRLQFIRKPVSDSSAVDFEVSLSTRENTGLTFIRWLETQHQRNAALSLLDVELGKLLTSSP